MKAESIKIQEHDPRAPKGFIRLNAWFVFLNPLTKRLVVLGGPRDEDHPDFDEISHNCDAMGCGTFDHVIVIGTAKEIGL